MQGPVPSMLEIAGSHESAKPRKRESTLMELVAPKLRLSSAMGTGKPPNHDHTVTCQELYVKLA